MESYSSLVNENQFLASPATGTDARHWLATAAAYVITWRIDVLLESVCRNPEDFAELAQSFHNGSYRVEVAIMAVPEGLSRLGILTRFHERLPEAGSRNLPPRLTPRKVHDDS
ncbi:zeta toxin domain-containing protein [Xylariales sp. AK1849]|nr:zeta toxin domain-containing protein [Xylariales sp. AK1849]